MPIALISVRWLHLLTSILLASLFLFEAAILLPATRKPSSDIGHLLDTIHRLTWRTALWTLLMALISWFAWSWLVASTMTGDDLVEFSGTPGKCLRPDTSFKARPVFRDDRIRCLESFLAEAKDNG